MDDLAKARTDVSQLFIRIYKLVQNQAMNRAQITRFSLTLTSVLILRLFS